MTKRSPLTLVWLKAYLREGSPTFLNATASAVKAGYKAKTPHMFEQIGFANRQRFEPKIAKWLDDHGFSEAKLKTKVLDLMEAKETKFFAHNGIVTDQRDVEALGIQVKALDMALKVKGIYAAEKVEHSGAVVTKIELTDADRAMARKLIDQAAQKLMEAKRAKPA
jgi:hypothetical protein